MELRVLQYFLAVAREQSISAAAKALEEELGKQLLIRGTKGSRKVILTEEGMILRKRAEEILSLVRRTEDEIACTEDSVAGDVWIGSGETEIVRLFARTAKAIQKQHPDIRYHISSGNADFVMDQLDKGLIDFGLLYDSVDMSKYDTLKVPLKDVWGVLMRRDSPLADREAVRPEDLWDKPLIVSHQANARRVLSDWLKRDLSGLNVVATYNLVLNASILTDEGFGYTICYDKLLDIVKSESLCFRPLTPALKAEATIVWKKYQVFSRASEVFLRQLQKNFSRFDSPSALST